MGADSALPTTPGDRYTPISVKAKPKPRVVVTYNRDFEQAQADPENVAREDIAGTAHRIIQALRAGGYDARPVPVGDDVGGVMRAIERLAPVAVFNLCESLGGDNRFEALLPMLLDLGGISYTGSAPLALALALHKNKAKEVLRASGITTPRGACIASPSALAALLDGPAGGAADASGPLRFPLMAKPAREDASVGICSDSVARDPEALRARVTHLLERYQQPAIVEEYIEGREINVSVLARPDGSLEVLPMSEIDFSAMPLDRPRIVSFEGKWVEGSDEFHGTRPVPCVLPADVESKIKDLAVRGFAAMELRDYGRFDVRLTTDGVPFVIDVNPNCDLSEPAGFARAARAAGLTYDALILRITELALSRRAHADSIPLAQRSPGSRGVDRTAEPDADNVSAGGDLLRAGAPGRGAGSS